MAYYTDIDPNTLLPGEPWTSAKALAAFENPQAIAEGADGAPRIRGAAIAQYAELPVLTVAASNDVSLAFSNAVLTLASSSSSSANPPTVVARRITISAVTGSVRFKATQSLAAGTSRVALYRNGILLIQYNETDDSITHPRSYDSAAIPGDVFEWRIGSIGGVTTLGAAGETATDGYVPISPLIAFSAI